MVKHTPNYFFFINERYENVKPNQETTKNKHKHQAHSLRRNTDYHLYHLIGAPNFYFLFITRKIIFNVIDISKNKDICLIEKVYYQYKFSLSLSYLKYSQILRINTKEIIQMIFYLMFIYLFIKHRKELAEYKFVGKINFHGFMKKPVPLLKLHKMTSLIIFVEY